jgi:chromosome partitioning protein
MSVKLDYEKLKEKRIEIDITQKELSEKTGVNINVLKSIETGRTVSDKENIIKICEELGISIDSVYQENYRETKVIGIINNKGGSGKSSLAGSLAYALTESGNRCLLIDTDAQMNLTHSLNIGKQSNTIYEAILKEDSLDSYIINTEFDNIDIIPSSIAMSAIEMVLFTKLRRESIIEKILHPVVEKGVYDYVIIDTNPTLGLLNYNVANACDYIIIPVILSSFGVEGVDLVVNFINDVSKFNKKTKILGIVINAYDKRKRNINIRCEAVLLEWGYENLILNSRISIDSHMENAQLENIPLLSFDPNSKAAKDYRNLAKEVISKC